jgi:hypothetical protein
MGQSRKDEEEAAHIFGHFYPRLRLCINFDKNAFGDIFHELFWSPCNRGTFYHSHVENYALYISMYCLPASNDFRYA